MGKIREVLVAATSATLHMIVTTHHGVSPARILAVKGPAQLAQPTLNGVLGPHHHRHRQHHQIPVVRGVTIIAALQTTATTLRGELRAARRAAKVHAPVQAPVLGGALALLQFHRPAPALQRRAAQQWSAIGSGPGTRLACHLMRISPWHSAVGQTFQKPWASLCRCSLLPSGMSFLHWVEAMNTGHSQRIYLEQRRTQLSTMNCRLGQDLHWMSSIVTLQGWHRLSKMFSQQQRAKA